MKSQTELRADALAVFQTALTAADPHAAVLRALRCEGNTLILQDRREYELGHGRVIVIGAGKAGAPMAIAIEQILGNELAGGAVTVKYGHVAGMTKVHLNEAGHPLPDENGIRGTRQIASLLQGLSEVDLVICLLSGGGSALLELPVEGVTLADFRVLTNALLRCGATIYEINTLRKHLSQVKGGGLARLAQPAQLWSLILSDVLGSPLDVIASGPTAPDSTTFDDAMSIVEKYNLRGQLPAPILSYLERGSAGQAPETPKADDPLFARVTNVVVADNSIVCEVAMEAARAQGYNAKLLSTQVQGEARQVGVQLARQAKETLPQADAAPFCLVAGGETTVMVRGNGLGGRCQELALAAAREIQGVESLVVLAAGTDGTDGPTDADGAIADGSTIARGRALGLDPDAYLENNDSYHFFRALGDLIVTGPTNTNVNDLMLVLSG